MNNLTDKPAILIFIGNYLPGYKAGGILRSVANTVDYLCDDFEFWIVTRDRDLGDDKPYADIKRNHWTQVGNAKVYYLQPQSSTLKNIFNLIVSTPHQLLYLNSFFDLLTIKVLLIRKFRLLNFKHVIVSPRGEFGSGSLGLKYLKKITYIQMARLFGLCDKVTWDASSEFEAHDIIKVMNIKPDAIYIVPSLPNKITPDNNFNESFHVAPNDEGLRIIFLSRIAREKNLDYALKILIKVRARVFFDIYGPATDAIYWNECQELINLLPVNIIVNYQGSVSPNEVVNTFSRYDLALIPTTGENYGHVIAESLTAGTPVLISDNTPWRNLLADGFGWDINLEQMDSFVEIIDKYALVSAEERYNNRQLVKLKIRDRLHNNSVLEVNRQIFKEMLMRPFSQASYRICSNCIMDTSDPGITFDEQGLCDYCRNYYENIKPNWHPNDKDETIFTSIIEKIKKDGKERDHDCLIGISGGVDSSYVTYLAKEKFGLRPMLFHVDAGWNSQEAVHNIERLVDGLGLDLYTEVIDWPEMKDLQLAFFKSQVPHIDTPQDHVFFAGLYNFAAKNGHKYILTGANYSTECVREPLEWHYHASDLRQIKDIHHRFGQRPLKKFPTADIFKYKIFYRFVKGVRVVKPLNYVPYIKEKAMQELAERFGWQTYAYKHYESRFTRFYEGYWLPKKFGYDKHRAHFSSLILTKQMTREEALTRIAQPAYDEKTIAQDFEYIAKKLDLTVSELQEIMNGKNKTYRDYKNSKSLINFGTTILRMAGIQKVIIR